MNAAPKGSIQNPAMGRKPKTPATIRAAPTTLRTPGGTRLSPHWSARNVVDAILRRSARAVPERRGPGPGPPPELGSDKLAPNASTCRLCWPTGA